jgi:hypothetical protein
MLLTRSPYTQWVDRNLLFKTLLVGLNKECSNAQLTGLLPSVTPPPRIMYQVFNC